MKQLLKLLASSRQFARVMPKLGSNHTCLEVIAIDSSLKDDENYYLQVLLKECKYIEKEKIRG